MVFSSNIFLFFFLPAALILYYLSPRRFRNLTLFLVSLVFYGWGEPVYLFLMLFVILLNYLSGMLLAKAREKKRMILAGSIAVNLLLLGFFKYAAFFVRTVNSVLPPSSALPVPAIALPIGISFYIFQSMSYTIDVYRGEVAAQKDPVTFGAYVSMFPQLIAGPIVRYKDVAIQLKERRESLPAFSYGVQLFIIGLAKKVLLANRMGELWEALRGTGGTCAAWVCVFAYSLQIYFDFSGYSDMAIGLGRMLGFDFLRNFDYPYTAKSVTEFWRRWHISLGTWFREYVYIPLGGNRRGAGRQMFNILAVWFLTGLWHGADWNFVLWGLYYALLLILEKRFFLKRMERWPGAVRVLLTFLTVSIGWILFSYTDLGEIRQLLMRLFTLSGETAYSRNRILAYLPLLLICLAGSTPVPAGLAKRLALRKERPALRAVFFTALLLLCTASLAARSYNPFIYFRF